MKKLIALFLISFTPGVIANVAFPMIVEKVVVEGAGANYYEETNYKITATTYSDEKGLRIETLRVEVAGVDILFGKEEFEQIVNPNFTLVRVTDDCCIMGRGIYVRFHFGPVLSCEIPNAIDPTKFVYIEIDPREKEAKVSILNPCELHGI